MACGGCGKRRAAREVANKDITKDNIMGGYKYLTDRQIKARLEIYKKRYCSSPVCDKRYECDYELYTKCKKNE